MASRARTEAVCLTAAQQALLDANFHRVPTFRMGFDAHVRRWQKHTGLAALVAYDRNPAFRAAYEARRYGGAL